MTRRGHDAWSWGVLGALLGPLVIPLALATTHRDRETSGLVETWHAGKVGQRTGLCTRRRRWFGRSRGGRLYGDRTFRTTARPRDTRRGDRSRSRRVGQPARAGIEPRGTTRCSNTPRRTSATSILTPSCSPGNPHTPFTNTRWITTSISSRSGRTDSGLSKAVLGSVAARLVQQQDVPVLVVGSGMPRSARRRSRSAGDGVDGEPT